MDSVCRVQKKKKRSFTPHKSTITQIYVTKNFLNDRMRGYKAVLILQKF